MRDDGFPVGSALDERVALAREHLQPDWDDLRETRVLRRVREAAQPSARRNRQPWFGVVALCGVAAAVTFVALSVKVPLTDETETAQNEAPGAESVLSFNDGSRAVLASGANVTTTEQTPERIRLRQSAGAVRYEVEPGVPRSFEVEARNVVVKVVGTVFSVEVKDEHVAVNVTRGKVLVVDNGRTISLTAGDHLEVAAAADGQAPRGGPSASNKGGKTPRSTLASSDTLDDPLVDPPETTALGLMQRADAARRDGNLADASEALRTLIQDFPDDGRATTAWFTLGRVEHARGRYAAAAQAFRAVERRAGRGALAEDAIAESANSWFAAGNMERGQNAAQRYLDRYPEGAHAGRMRRLLQGASASSGTSTAADRTAD